MRSRRTTVAICLLLMSVLAPVPFLAADDGAETGQERDLSRVRKKVEALRAWRLTEELDLDEGTMSKLFPAMKEMDQERWRIEARNRTLVREMNRLLRTPDPDRRRIDEILNELQANRQEMARIEARHLNRIRQILPPDDVARYLMFQIKFQREIRQKAAEAFRERRESRDRRGNQDRRRPGEWEEEQGGFGGSDSGAGGSDRGGSERGRGR